MAKSEGGMIFFEIPSFQHVYGGNVRVAYLAETGLFGGKNSQINILSPHIFS